MRHPHAKLIERVGSNVAIARSLGIKNRQSITNWKRGGIPLRYARQFVAFSKENGTPVTLKEIFEGLMEVHENAD